MTRVGSHEAKAHLPDLLKRVAKGEKILITRRGQAVAMLVPPPQEGKADTHEVVEEMLAFRDRRQCTLGDLTFRNLIEEGRR